MALRETGREGNEDMDRKLTELLTRAHGELSRLRDGATTGTWEVGGDPGEDIWEITTEYPNYVPVVYTDSGYKGGQDASLIAVLHRTIDAQLEVLELAMEISRQRHSVHPSRIERRGETLARAILGETDGRNR